MFGVQRSMFNVPPPLCHLCNCISMPSGCAFRQSVNLAPTGRDAATAHGKSQLSLRHAKYFPVPPGGLSIGPGTINRIIGNRKNFRPRLKFSSCGNFRNPATNGPLITKSLFPNAIAGVSRLAKRKSNCRSACVIGMPWRTLELNCVGGSAAINVSADAKQSRKTVVFISPFR
jgi:hypothetical protein